MKRMIDVAARSKNASAVWRWLVLWCLVVMPTWAELKWVAATDTVASSAIVAGDQGAVLCRGSWGGQIYVGYALDGVCTVVVGTPTAGLSQANLSSYEVGVGLTQWLNSIPPGGQALIGSQAGVAALRPCRVEGRIGYVRSDEVVCRLAKDGFVNGLSSYDLLFPIDTGDGVYIHNAVGMCVTPDSAAGGFAPKACDYAKSELQRLRLESVGTGIYQIGVLGTIFNLNLCMATGTSSGAVAMASCGTPATRLRVFDANGSGKFKIRFESTGNYLDGLGLNTLLPAYFQRALNQTADQRFEIRTPADAARRMRVISYNIMLLNNNFFAGLRQLDRAKWIVQQLELEEPGTDVVAIQEAFDEGNVGALSLNSGFDALVGAMEKAGYVYRTQRPFAAQPENGGVVIFSRWPIEVRDNNVFDLFKCEGFDCLSAKGINYAKVNKLGRRYHFFNTHLQAGFNNWDFRRRQLEEFRPWIDGLVQGRTDEPIILTGDYNIDMEHQPDNYREMLSLIGAQFVNAPRPVGVPTGPLSFRYTADPAVNEITRVRGGSAEWLDYILCGYPGPMAIEASYRVKNYQRSEEYRIDTILDIFDTKDLSDHAALLGTLVFPYGSRVTPLVMTVPVRFEAVSTNSRTLPPATIRVNGERVALPVTLQLESTLTHQIEQMEIPTTGGERWRPMGWSHVNTNNWSLVNPTRDITYKAQYAQEYELVVQANPPAGGTTTGSGWYSPEAGVEYSAAAQPGYRFVNFSGDLATSATANPGRLRMNGPKRLVANFESTLVNTRFEVRNSSGALVPKGAVVRVDGVAYPLPVSLPLDPTRIYRIEAGEPAAGPAERWIFQRWLHTASPAWDLVRPANNATYTVELQEQYLLDVTASPLIGGSVTGGGWYAAGSTANLSATAQSGYVFVNYSGDVTGTSAATSVAMSSGRKVLASFRVAGLPVLVAQPGARSGSASTRTMALTLNNIGKFDAQNTRITSISTQVLEGTGTVAATDRLPLSYGLILKGSGAVRTLSFDWPETARRVQFVMQIQADGGYTNTVTLNLYRN